MRSSGGQRSKVPGFPLENGMSVLNYEVKTACLPVAPQAHMVACPSPISALKRHASCVVT